MMRRIGTIALLILILLLILAGGILLLRFDPFGWDFSLIRREQLSARESILMEARAIYRVDTVELVHKCVFPYDFIPAEPDWRLLFYAEQTRRLSDEEAELLAFYHFCRELGIDLASRDPGFAVVTVVARAGFDFTDFPLEGKLVLSESGIEITLPEPVVTNLIIQDSGSDTYPYPGLEISPENWKRLTEYIAENMDEVIAQTSLLERARQRGEELFRRLVEARGFATVLFRYTE
jgi:Protein of unknown function (DUF4230)